MSKYTKGPWQFVSPDIDDSRHELLTDTGNIARRDIGYLLSLLESRPGSESLSLDGVPDAIKQAICNAVFEFEDTVLDMRAVDAAAEAIVELIARQPVDKVRAMAALVVSHGWAVEIFFVPGDGNRCMYYEVNLRGAPRCSCGVLDGNCIHIQAVEYHLAAQETGS